MKEGKRETIKKEIIMVQKEVLQRNTILNNNKLNGMTTQWGQDDDWTSLLLRTVCGRQFWDHIFSHECI